MLVVPYRGYGHSSIALRISTAHNFTGDQRAYPKMAAFSLRLDLAREVYSHFLENEYGDLSFFSVFRT